MKFKKKRNYGSLKLKDCINAIFLVTGKTIKQSMIVERKSGTKTIEIKNIYNHYLDKRTDTMKNTQFKVEEVFSDTLGEKSVSNAQVFTLYVFLAKMTYEVVLV